MQGFAERGYKEKWNKARLCSSAFGCAPTSGGSVAPCADEGIWAKQRHKAGVVHVVQFITATTCWQHAAENKATEMGGW